MVAGYSDLVVDHFEHPRNSGHLLAAADVIAATGGSRHGGVEFTLTARIVNEQVTQIRFRAFGCPHSIAAASWLAERLPGARIEQLEQWHWRDLAAALEIPIAKRGRLLILQDSVQSLAASWRKMAENEAM